MIDAAATPPASQTLSRGIQVLEFLADASTGPAPTIDAVAVALGVHRSIAYRLVRTLESHGLVHRNARGSISLAPKMAALAAGVARDLQAAAAPELTALADELGVTSFIAVADRDECITLASIEPRHTVASVAQRPGARHSLAVGAPSKAILSAIEPEQWPVPAEATLRAEVARVGAAGYATSHDEVIPTVRSIAVPLRLGATHRPAALAVVHVDAAMDVASVAARLTRAANSIANALGA